MMMVTRKRVLQWWFLLCLTEKIVDAFVTPLATTKHSKLQIADEWIYQVQSTANELANEAMKGQNMATLPTLYAAGLLTSLSPCIWSLWPLTVSSLLNASNNKVAVIVFGAGVASVLVGLGVTAAALGGAVAVPSEWLSLVANLVCCVAALQLLELVPGFAPPTPVVAAPREESGPVLISAQGSILNQEPATQSLAKTFVLGATSAVVASPCATPVLTSILASVATLQSNATLTAAVWLFVYTAGTLTPLLALAVTGTKAIKGPSSKLAPWITPITGGILLSYGITGVLVALWGEPSLRALAPVFE